MSRLHHRPRWRPRARLSTALTTALTGAVIIAAPASASAAGWSAAKVIQSGSDPILAFSPSGAAAIGSQLTAKGHASQTNIDLAPEGITFAKSPWNLSAPSAGHGPEPLAALALSTRGYVAAAFAAPNAATPVLSRVTKSAPSSFAGVQQLIAYGRAPAGQTSPDTVKLAATSAGEIVSAGTDDDGRLFTGNLSVGATTFTTAAGPGGLGATDAYALSTDATGRTFLAGDGPNGCTTVAVRSAHGTFKTTYRTGNCASATPNIFDAITATGHGAAGLLSEDVSESGLEPDRLLLQVGTNGRFGTATQLSADLGAGPVGLASDADGELTASWSDCESGSVVNGQLSQLNCDVTAAVGSVTKGISAVAAAAPAATLVHARPGTTLTAVTADRGVAASRCAGTKCTFYGFTATADGFRKVHTLGTGTRLITLTGDDHGDLLAVWTDAQHRLYAATASAVSGRWSGAHRLSAGAVDPSTVAAAYGAKRTALVAWSVGARTYAAGYSTSGP